MRRIGPDAWAGLAMLAGCVVVGAPVLFGAGETRVPRLLWALLFAAPLMALVTAAVLEDAGTVAAWAAYAAAVVLSWAVVLTASGAGWLPILLVFVAAVSGYLVPVWAGAAVVASASATTCPPTRTWRRRSSAWCRRSSPTPSAMPRRRRCSSPSTTPPTAPYG
ncbi:hypothetical protein ABZW11_44660 [Nonomuraea sp. NPDC004580]|uniref:hypothetical protein n=1 Tax=Nonomuraea sp. NPDC004580 TaxID=3154552 RepID=UPI0033B3BF20